MTRQPVKIGIGGPVGSGKTALLDALCKRLRGRYDMAVITNDIYTYEDAEFLVHSGALPPERIRGVQTGGCPHTAIREDTSIDPFPDARMATRQYPKLTPTEAMLNVVGDTVMAGHSFAGVLADAQFATKALNAEPEVPGCPVGDALPHQFQGPGGR